MIKRTLYYQTPTNLISSLDNLIVDVGNIEQIDDIDAKIAGQNALYDIETHIWTKFLRNGTINKSIYKDIGILLVPSMTNVSTTINSRSAWVPIKEVFMSQREFFFSLCETIKNVYLLSIVFLVSISQMTARAWRRNWRWYESRCWFWNCSYKWWWRVFYG